MPFKSKSQQRFMFAKHPKMAREWAHETKDIKALPEKVKEKTSMHSTMLASFYDELEKISAMFPGGLAMSAKNIVKNFSNVRNAAGARIPPGIAAAKAAAGHNAAHVAGQGARAAQVTHFADKATASMKPFQTESHTFAGGMPKITAQPARPIVSGKPHAETVSSRMPTRSQDATGVGIRPKF